MLTGEEVSVVRPVKKKLLFNGSAGPFFAGNEVLFFLLSTQNYIAKVLVYKMHIDSYLFQVCTVYIR